MEQKNERSISEKKKKVTKERKKTIGPDGVP